MDKTANIRNVSVVASSGDGQLALTDLLFAKGGSTPPASSNSTAKPVVNSMYFELNEEQMEDIAEKEQGNGFLISLVNSSSHDYTSADVAAALRVTDSVLVVADVVSGVPAQVEAALRMAHAEMVKPVLLIDGVDRALLEHRLAQEDLYQSFRHVIENVSVTISSYQDKNAMGSQLGQTQGWCFALRQFATRYAKELGIERSKLMAKLWGDNFYDSQTKMWSTQSSDATGKNADRGFNLLVLDPIYKLFGASLEGDADKALALADKLGIILTAKERTLADKALLTDIIGKYLPAADALMDMFCICLPSPAKAQSYRCSGLYEGPQDDESAAGIRACDPSGPLMLYVSRMVPASDKGRFYAFGRVFSGTVKPGQRVRIQGPNYTPGKHTDLFVTTTQSTVIMMGSSIESIDDCPAGNIVGLVGIDQYLLNSGTITTSETAHNMKAIKFSYTPVVNITVDVINLKDLPKLVEGLKRLSKASPSVKCSTSDTGVHTIAGASELHLTRSLRDLEEDYAQIPIAKGTIFAEYRETIQAKSSAIMMARSPNRHSRFYLTAEPIQEELAVLIDDGKIAASDDINERACRLINEFEWDASDARKIWAFGPAPSGANLLVSMAKGVQYLSEIKDSCVLGFNYTVAEGPCVGAPMRGCRFNILDVTLQTDAIHRGAGQILPTMRRAIYGAMLLANPSLQEPIYIVDVQCPRDIVSSVHSLIHDLLGHIIEESQQPGSLLCSVKAYLPVAKSLGFSKLLHKEAGGMASLRTMTFAHWKTVEGLANEPGEALNMCLSIRKCKGMPENIPAHDYYIDKS
ncbi:translation elongation factor 2 [Coemansia sp. RSA 2424]|nr:translation elongation factor 2 [Coemansia sp. RSA 2424]